MVDKWHDCLPVVVSHEGEVISLKTENFALRMNVAEAREVGKSLLREAEQVEIENHKIPWWLGAALIGGIVLGEMFWLLIKRG